MNTITTNSGHEFRKGDSLNVPIEMFGIENYNGYNEVFVATDITSTELTIRPLSQWERFIRRFLLKPLRAWRFSDWMPDDDENVNANCGTIDVIL